jgi:alpha-maltose-1-phosphate synthase
MLRICQSTWVRYHHFDLARELEQMGHLTRLFTALPWWKADKESREQQIPRNKISCNFLFQGTRRVGKKFPGYSPSMDSRLAVEETKFYSRWVARKLPECDAYIGISGSGLHAGRLAKSRGAGYILDRGSAQIRFSDRVLREEHEKWGQPWTRVHPWLIENEEAEAEEADFITVPSHFVMRTFIDQGTPPEKIRVVPYGVSLTEFFPTQKPPTDVFRLLFVGNFGLRKGAPYLLEAFDKFKHPHKELVVVGSVSREMEGLMASLPTDGVRFVGVKSRDEVKDYMSGAHALVLPSIEEGLALVQGQAMACGCPIIATPNTGSETLFENEIHGLIVDPRSASALTAAFTRLADDEVLRQRMSDHCIVRVSQFEGWNTYAKGMVEVAKESKAARTA